RRLTTGRLIAIDRDGAAIGAARERLSAFEDKITFVRGNFRDLAQILDGLGIGGADGLLFDLGVSSPQLDNPERGFSYMSDAPLDMRMDERDAVTAYALINGSPEEELRRILYEYGEERYAPRIASELARRRAERPIETTAQLVDAIRAAMPGKALREKQHPAKRSFQAIRIAVNDELGAVREAMAAAPDKLKPGGRLCVISFHSLEDRLVKTAMNSRVNGCTCPPDFPVCVCGFSPTLRLITKKAVAPEEEELRTNPRSRSAKLRIAERI
ncbi:MAG: 16S rRNA (cytosine(1402)-N(4))-methyltransferase RsmH, partial [Oscillospiraceae bacterium]|nr:16S rRNA (cytosine(1402)-N(4))-methyltransferase RsmH [Oscillospiraceae bacterium]